MTLRQADNLLMPMIDGLPAGLSARPLTIADADAVHAVIAAEEEVDLGAAEMTVEDVVADWQRPSYDIAASTVGVLDGDLLVAYADLSDHDVAYTAVLPTYQGRGVGTALARWLQDKARAGGSTRLGSTVPAGSAAERLLTDLGYEVQWSAWDFELPADREITPRPLPDGFTLRTRRSRTVRASGRCSRTPSWSGSTATG